MPHRATLVTLAAVAATLYASVLVGEPPPKIRVGPPRLVENQGYFPGGAHRVLRVVNGGSSAIRLGMPGEEDPGTRAQQNFNNESYEVYTTEGADAVLGELRSELFGAFADYKTTELPVELREALDRSLEQLLTEELLASVTAQIKLQMGDELALLRRDVDACRLDLENVQQQLQENHR